MRLMMARNLLDKGLEHELDGKDIMNALPS